MTIKTLFLISLTALLVSCNKADIYSKLDKDFSDNRWGQTDAKTYNFTITDDTKSYDLIFRFSHVYDYQFASVPLDFTITDPSGKKENFTVDLKIKDSSGKELGDCLGDICDLQFKIKEKTRLIKGNYKLTVSNTFPGPYLPNVLGVGLDVATVE
ncbi:hypothetical protein FLJC2902T_11120 [Flavobacterium limnosediminis JC2902]|uniref:Gliding motility-associated lipoprotein GldH n=1 Tax=Flavobacterium limnosediminis JC2902 TaxID=1341181 RepID=V6SXD4_9FLAO|nr:hypothetical protein [Flavobacterium limnosediminis]ESU29075.1 hypothetical protein FLJC2902T_11120 [Flavobacterium limnosediminis JC2902]